MRGLCANYARMPTWERPRGRAQRTAKQVSIIDDPVETNKIISKKLEKNNEVLNIIGFGNETSYLAYKDKLEELIKIAYNNLEKISKKLW